MRSGWPHTQDDHGVLPDGQQQPFNPEISWPTGYSGLEYRDGDYRYPAPPGAQPYAARPSAAPSPAGEHPYAAFSGNGNGTVPGGYAPAGYASAGYAQPNIESFGYGDPGYSNPSYDGPASQDLGVASTRTVSGFVESSNQGGYALPATNPTYMLPPGHPSGAYPAIGTAGDAHPYQPRQAAEMYEQPWDYDQPLRYDGEEPAYPGLDNYGSFPREAPSLGGSDYNGSDYSMPGVSGMGYDLSGIIQTGEFPEIGYDQPSYDRLSYDDPRYDNGSAHGRGQNGTHTRYDMPALDGFGVGNGLGAPRRSDTRFDLPALDSFDDFDDTRLDHVWPAAEELPGEGGPASAEDKIGLVGFSRRLTETRFDIPAIPDGVPERFDETQIDGVRALGLAADTFDQAGPGLLAPADAESVNWADETSLDMFQAVGPTQMTPLAFRSQGDVEPARTETGSRRAIGKRRGRSGDKRQWMALSAIAVVAAGAIGFVVMKFANSGPSGPAHTVSTPNTAASFTREPNLEQQMKVSTLASEITRQSSGQASDVVSAVYQQGSSTPGSDPQTFIFVGGKLANGDPSASVTQFDQQYSGAHRVSAGPLGGEAACGQATANGESVAMCVWFDNDTFGDLVSSTMTPATLASTLTSVRPSLEHLAS